MTEPEAPECRLLDEDGHIVISCPTCGGRGTLSVLTLEDVQEWMREREEDES